MVGVNFNCSESPYRERVLCSCANLNGAKCCEILCETASLNPSELRRCISYRINSDCHLDQDDKDCLISSESNEALGMNLGECPFSAKPEGGLGDASWALFRKGAISHC